MPKSHLTITDRASVTRLDSDANGRVYDTGEILDTILTMRCQCGHEFTLLESQYESTKPESCSQPCCPYSTPRAPGRQSFTNEPRVSLPFNCPASLAKLLQDRQRRLKITRSQAISDLLAYALEHVKE